MIKKTITYSELDNFTEEEYNLLRNYEIINESSRTGSYTNGAIVYEIQDIIFEQIDDIREDDGDEVADNIIEILEDRLGTDVCSALKNKEIDLVELV